MLNTKRPKNIIDKLNTVKDLTNAKRLITVCNEVIAEIPKTIDDRSICEKIREKLDPTDLKRRWEEFNKTRDSYDLPDVKDSGEALKANIKEVISLLDKQLKKQLNLVLKNISQILSYINSPFHIATIVRRGFCIGKV